MENLFRRVICGGCKRMDMGMGMGGNGRIQLWQRVDGTACKRMRTIHTSSILRAGKGMKGTKKTAGTGTRIEKKTGRERERLEYRPSSRPPPPRPSISPPPPRPNPLKYRTIPIIFGSVTLFALSGYITYLLITLTRDPPPFTITTSSFALQTDVSARYDDIANDFDDKVEFTEWVMGIKSLRKKLVGRARGDVLEVSVGTGRNLGFYSFEFSEDLKKLKEKEKKKKGGVNVKSLTVLDKSPEMLEVAHEKFGKLYPGILGVRWIIADACLPSSIPPPPKNANELSGNKEGGKYDTIIQTMGLCSVSDPVALLKNLGEVLKEEEGRLILLEHGRGGWGFLDRFLDRWAERHANEFGCWWNRDLDGIIGRSGLVVLEKGSRHLGTTGWWVLKRGRAEKEAGNGGREEVVGK